MGVKGLTRTISETNSLGTTLYLKQNHDLPFTTLVIDGWSVIYFVSKDLPWHHGGSSKRFANSLRNFLSQLQNTFYLFFILDGMTPPSKFETRISRQNERIRKNEDIMWCYDGAGYCGDNGYVQSAVAQLMQPCIVTIAIDVLRSLGIEYQVSLHEADEDVANMCLLNPKSAVMSHDSDFWIYNVPYFVHLNYISFSGDAEYKRITHFKYFEGSLVCKNLGLMDAKFLPLLAFFCGCDYVSYSSSKLIEKQLKVCKQNKVRSMAQVIQNFVNGDSSLSLLNAGMKILASMNLSVQQRGNLENELLVTITEYTRLNLPQVEIVSDTRSELFKKGFYHHKLLDLKIYKYFWCSSFLEDTTKRSGWEPYFQIRQELYSVILFEDSIDSSTLYSVQEYDRVGSLVQKTNHSSKKVLVSHPEVLLNYLRIMGSSHLSDKNLEQHLIPFICIIRATLFAKYHQDAPLDTNEIYGIICAALESFSAFPLSPCLCSHQGATKKDDQANKSSRQSQGTRISKRFLQIMTSCQIACLHSLLLMHGLGVMESQNPNDVVGCRRCAFTRGHYAWFDGEVMAYSIEKKRKCSSQSIGTMESKIFALCKEGYESYIKKTELSANKQFRLLSSGCDFS